MDLILRLVIDPKGNKMNLEIDDIFEETQSALNEFLMESGVKSGQVIVLGCSTSEVAGERIGQASNEAYGRAIIQAVLPIVRSQGLYLAVQCCEHLNRALVVEEEAAEKYNFELVTVVPVLKAGGAAATAAYRLFNKPVMVEKVAAHGGLDIGDTEIGMHVIPVQVPVRLSIKKIGQASLTCLKRRPKFIGGARAQYELPAS